jgi:antitoxin component of RelBE/YafQ-DinJ toxin-antitoxin module
MTVASLLKNEYALDYEVKMESHKVTLNFTNELSILMDIEGSDTWNTVGNKIARKLGIPIDSLVLEPRENHTEKIKQDIPCEDILRKSSNLKVSYLDGDHQFQRMDLQDNDDKIRLILVYNEIVRNY